MTRALTLLNTRDRRSLASLKARSRGAPPTGRVSVLRPVRVVGETAGRRAHVRHLPSGPEEQGAPMTNGMCATAPAARCSRPGASRRHVTQREARSMGWERRDRGGTYYTRSRREDGRVVREYVGTGAAAELAAALDVQLRETRRRLRQQQRARWRAELSRLERMDEHVDAVDAFADLVMAASLRAAGYHLHHRSEWRRRHGAQA